MVAADEQARELETLQGEQARGEAGGGGEITEELTYQVQILQSDKSNLNQALTIMVRAFVVRHSETMRLPLSFISSSPPSSPPALHFLRSFPVLHSFPFPLSMRLPKSH